MTRPELSVVVPTFNRKDILARGLQALSNQSLPPDRYEVVVVVDGSTDGTTQMLTKFSAPCSLKVIDQPNKGRAGACNAGVRASQGEILLFVDDDVLADYPLLEEHVSSHQRGPFGGVLGPLPVVVTADSRFLTWFMARKFERLYTRWNTHPDEIEVYEYYTANFSIPRAIVNEIGLFDEGFRYYGGEDGDFLLRLKAAGYPVTFNSKAIGHQYYLKDLRTRCRDAYQAGRAAVIMGRKHPEASPKAPPRRRTWLRHLVQTVALGLGRRTELHLRLMPPLLGLLGRFDAPWVYEAYAKAFNLLFWMGVQDESSRAPMKWSRGARA